MKEAVFELTEPVSLIVRGIAIVDALDENEEPAFDISNIGNIDDMTALGLLEGAAAIYRKRIVESTEDD